MPLSDDKRTDWLYAHFQAVTRLSDRYLALFGVLVVSATALWLASDGQVELPFLKVAADRQLLLGCVLIAALFTFVAFCGNYDYGEHTLKALAKQLDCDYDDLWLVDTHPTIVDFARFRRPETAAKRGVIARVSVAMLYPVILLSALAWLVVMWGYEAFVREMTLLQAIPYMLIVLILYPTLHRALEYWMRRWRAWRGAERLRHVKQTSPQGPGQRNDAAGRAV